MMQHVYLQRNFILLLVFEEQLQMHLSRQSQLLCLKVLEKKKLQNYFYKKVLKQINLFLLSLK